MQGGAVARLAPPPAHSPMQARQLLQGKLALSVANWADCASWELSPPPVPPRGEHGSKVKLFRFGGWLGGRLLRTVCAASRGGAPSLSLGCAPFRSLAQRRKNSPLPPSQPPKRKQVREAKKYSANSFLSLNRSNTFYNNMQSRSSGFAVFQNLDKHIYFEVLRAISSIERSIQNECNDI